MNIAKYIEFDAVVEMGLILVSLSSPPRTANARGFLSYVVFEPTIRRGSGRVRDGDAGEETRRRCTGSGALKRSLKRISVIGNHSGSAAMLPCRFSRSLS